MSRDLSHLMNGGRYDHIVLDVANGSRNFLLFLPIDADTAPLKAVIGYYSSVFALNAEGDAAVRDDQQHGLGKLPFLHASLDRLGVGKSVV